MMTAGISTVSMEREKDRTVDMGTFSWENCLASIRIMDSFANSEGCIV